MNLPRLLTIVTTVFGILMFASCQDSENCEKPPRDSTFKKNTYYAVQDTANGWEEGIYYNGTFLMAHANKKKGTILYYLDDSQYNSDKGIVFEVDPEDNHILKFGSWSNMADICESGNKLTLFEAARDGKNEIDARTVTLTTEDTKTLATKGNALPVKGVVEDWATSMIKKFLTKQIPHLDDILTAYEFSKQVHDEKWVKASLTILTTGISMIGGPSASAATLPLSMAISEYEAQVSEVQRFLYGYADIKITDIKKREDSGYNVTVEITGASSIPDKIVQNHTELGACVQKTYTNNVYCGVLARDVLDPWYNRTDVRSGEILVQKTDDYRTEYTLVVYPTGNNIKLRPYLISDLDFLGKERFKLSCDFVKHGETVPLVASDVDFTFRQTQAICDAYWDMDNGCYKDKKIKFQFEFNATCNAYSNQNITALRDWGLIIYRSGRVFHKFSMISESDSQGSGNIKSATSTQNFYFDENEMFVDYNNLTAVTDGDYTIGSYIEYCTDFNLGESKTTYGEAVPIEFKYDQKPSLRFINTKYYGTSNSDDPVSPSGFWYKGSGKQFISNNAVECELHGLLFLKTCILTKRGSGWNKECDSWYPYGGITPWQTAPWYFEEGIYESHCYFAFSGSFLIGSGSLDTEVELVVDETGRKIKAANKISFTPFYSTTSNGETYISGYKAVLK